MSKTLKRLSVAAFALCAAIPALAEEMTADSVVATVNGTEITLGHMLSARAGLPEQYQSLGTEVLWEGILDQLIQQEALAQDDLAEETIAVRIALDNERRSLLAAETIKAIAFAASTEEAIQAAYEAEILNGAQSKEYNASHILVETEEEAAEISKMATDGADFAELAKEKSTGPSGPNGGELGWFGRGMMVEEFQTAVEGMEAGAVSEPVKTQFGWHVIRLNETRDKEAPSLEDVRADLEDKLQQEAVRAYLDEATAKADITRTGKDDVNTDILLRADMLGE